MTTTETQTPPTYVDTVAPYPRREDDVTADAIARNIACQVHADTGALAAHYYLRSPVGDKQAARDFGLLASRLAGYYGMLGLLRALIEHAPDEADEVARQLWHDWEFGESPSERTAEWLVGYGIDPNRIEVASFERIERPVRVGAENGEG